MPDLNPTAQAAYRRSFKIAGVRISITRVTGAAPNTTSVSAELSAIVRDYQDDSAAVSREGGYGMSALGAITQGKRQVIVMADELERSLFPLPVQKNDKICVLAADMQLFVVQVDPEKLSMAGAIEMMAAGVE